jgi:glucosylglycerate hydrolase
MEEFPEGVSGEAATGGHHDVNPRATGVLRRNSIRSWTKPAPALYPHQWSWDSAFIALGLAHVDNRRATSELETLFESQWATGKVPHIVFNPDAPPRSYFPDAERWSSSTLSEDAPAGSHTSGLCQPPVHAIAVRRIWVTSRDKDEQHTSRARRFLHANYPRLFAWHRYLATARDPEGSGLVTIYHPWESGTDNSPRWDQALHNVEVRDLPPYTRYDLEHVDDLSQRPTDAEYDRYLWLVKLVKRASCDEATIYDAHPFLVKDVLFSAILVAANQALLEISQLVGASHEDAELISSWISRGRRGLDSCWDPKLRLCLDYDLRAAKPLRSRTVAGFAPLVAGGLRPRRLAALLETLRSPSFLRYPGLRRPLPPSTSPEDAGFNPRSYWRGPGWPVIDWLLWWAFVRAGEHQLAERVRGSSLEQIAEGGFAEYFEPFTGEPLGSREQSWTAAVALDWLASSPEQELRAA